MDNYDYLKKNIGDMNSRIALFYANKIPIDKLLTSNNEVEWFIQNEYHEILPQALIEYIINSNIDTLKWLCEHSMTVGHGEHIVTRFSEIGDKDDMRWLFTNCPIADKHSVLIDYCVSNHDLDFYLHCWSMGEYDDTISKESWERFRAKYTVNVVSLIHSEHDSNLICNAIASRKVVSTYARYYESVNGCGTSSWCFSGYNECADILMCIITILGHIQMPLDEEQVSLAVRQMDPQLLLSLVTKSDECQWIITQPRCQAVKKATIQRLGNLLLEEDKQRENEKQKDKEKRIESELRIKKAKDKLYHDRLKNGLCVNCGRKMGLIQKLKGSSICSKCES